MDVTSTGSTPTTTSPQGNSAASIDKATGGITSDFTTFLKMLTTQMQNQDPSNPMDSSDFAVQLATFSGVEQQVQTNQLLTSLASQLNVMGMSQLSGWVGMQALTTAPIQFSGTPLTLEPVPATGATSAELVTTDATGKEVARQAIPMTGDAVAWAGTDAGGNPLPNGTYSFSVDSYADGQLTASDPVAGYGRVTEARNEAGSVVLVMAGGSKVASSDVQGLRADG